MSVFAFFKIHFIFLFLVCVGFTAQTASAESADAIRDAISGQMAQRHPKNPAPFWTSLGPEALPVIQQMYAATKSPYEKTWLLDGMGYFTDPSVTTFLQGEIAHSTDNLLKGKMISAYIHAGGEASLDFVEPFLKDKDSNIRLETASDLKRYEEDPRIRARLDRFLAEEKVDWVKGRYEKADKIPVMRRSTGVFQPHGEPVPSPTPLPEKLWAGEWRGVFISAKKTSAVTLNLKALKVEANAESSASAAIAGAAGAGVGSVSPILPSVKAGLPPNFDAKWKIELKLPKQSRFELQGKEIEISYFLTKESHWLEIRDKKDERVVVVRRPVQTVAAPIPVKKVPEKTINSIKK